MPSTDQPVVSNAHSFSSFFELFDGMSSDKTSFAIVIKFPVCNRREACICTDNKLRQFKVSHKPCKALNGIGVSKTRIFNDKFVLSVVDLSKINLATDEDKASGLEYWARMFKAQTWEELKKLVKDDEYLQEAAQSIYIANSDYMVQQRCRAREEYERHERTVQRDLRRLKEQLEAQSQELEALRKELAKYKK